MGIFELILIGIGLSMDACAVSMTNGMCYKPKWRTTFLIAFAFGLFQGLMPLIGYLTGSLFYTQIAAFDHWIALILLCFIGGKMIVDGFKGEEACSVKPFGMWMLFMQAIATSIDALAVGISFAASGADILLAISLIAVSTFLLSTIAARVGEWIGDKLNTKAQLLGGVILVFIGIKIFVEHMWLS